MLHGQEKAIVQVNEEPYRLAAMDIGTNSARLLVVEVHPDYSWTTVAQNKEVVRLGEGEFDGGHKLLTDAAMTRATRVLARFAEMARGYGAREVVALATAATREAENKDEFVERIHLATQDYLDVQVISGDEEARLIYLGVSSGVDLQPDERALFMDIGGGSTELIVGDSARYFLLNSLKLGAIRLTAELLEPRVGVVSSTQWSALQRHVRSTLAPAARPIRQQPFTRMFGSSGTIISLAELAARKAHPLGELPTSLRNYELMLPDLQAVTQTLCRMTFEERRKLPGLSPERADIIIAGGAILQTTLETLGVNSIFISDRGLREGIVVDQLLREEGAAKHFQDASVRVRSTRRLARRCLVDERHAAHVTDLALQIFDQTKSLGLHPLGDDEREMLDYAGLLHDCGFFISHTAHQQHSYYIIRYAELLGFNNLEVETMALIALHHRKSLPRRRDPSFSALPEETQEIVRVLSCCLRLAETLDRSHLEVVERIHLTLLPGKNKVVTLAMQTMPTSDPSLEIWATQGQAEAFQKTFHATLEVVTQSLTPVPSP